MLNLVAQYIGLCDGVLNEEDKPMVELAYDRAKAMFSSGDLAVVQSLAGLHVMSVSTPAYPWGSRIDPTHQHFSIATNPNTASTLQMAPNKQLR
jgi:hypothetical protein